MLIKKQIHYLFICLHIVSFVIFNFRQSYGEDITHHVTESTETFSETYGEGTNTLLNFYQKWISPAKGGNKCPMHPSCSQYAKIAFHDLPLHQACLKTFERLLRCGNDLYLYKTISVNGKTRWHDPVSNKISQYEQESQKIIGQSLNNSLSISTIPYDQKISVNGFADSLFQDGEYYRAITEYYRCLYNSSDPTLKTEMYKNIGRCYFQGEDYRGYISFYDKKNGYFVSNPKIKSEMLLYLGKSYYHLNLYEKAISTIKWSDFTPQCYNENQLLLGIAYARLFDWQTSIEQLQCIEHDSPFKKLSERLIHSINNFPKLPQKSQFLAGSLSSIIPGSGYFYCNRKGTGLASFIVNGLLFWTIKDALNKKQYGLASTAGFFGLGWYIGNIKGSVEAASAYNTRIRNKFIDKLLENENLSEFKKED